MCQDARDLVIGCGIHVCSPSCFKYHSNKASQICRHNFYHRVTVYTEDEKHEKQLRRRGKSLRGCIGIFRETDYGMAGRIITFQLHPWETSTAYAALVAMRCNVDVQDMRRVLPPRLWMSPDDLEPDAEEEDRNTYNHGAFPQRYRGFSLGPQDAWGWYRHLNTSPCRKWDMVVFTDWHKIFSDLWHGDMTEAVPDAGSEEFDRLLEQNALATFIDAHSTSYYVNSYTTKVNPTMDGVLCKLLDGVRRLRDEWEDSEAQRQERARNGPPSEQVKQPRAIADARRRESFRRTMQVLCRFETCFRRASWKSGSEMVSPCSSGTSPS